MSIHNKKYRRAANGRSWGDIKIGELPVIAARARMVEIFQTMIEADPKTRLADRLHPHFGKAVLEYKAWRGLEKK
jgi:hypothetical protein